jgi:2-haloacid dehalogenase
MWMNIEAFHSPVKKYFHTTMKRREFLAKSTIGAAGTMLAGGASAASVESASDRESHQTMANRRPKLLFFDVNETLLDLKAMRERVAEALGGRGDLLPLWFTTMLQYSLVSTVGDNYDDFGAIGSAAMIMVARNHGIELSQEAAREAIMPIRSLPPHPEVAAALDQLRQAGFRMVTLTNSSHATVDAQIKNAGLTELFEDLLSIEDIQMFKPHIHVYRWAARKMGVRSNECLLVAAHGWDIAGALWAGWRAAFLSRPGAQLYPLAPAPEIVAPDLRLAAERLIAME